MATPPVTRYRTFVHDSARWEGFAWRPGDIVIATPPKCGTTWVQWICALLVFQTPVIGPPLDRISPRLDALTVEREGTLAILEAQQHRRFVKTHTPLDGLPYDDRATYICVGRDPRDVALSWDSHLANTDMAAFERARQAAEKGPAERPPAPAPHHGPDHRALGGSAPGLPPMWAANVRRRFWRWVDDPTPPQEADSSLRSTMHHLETFWDARDRPNIVLVHYAELKSDLAGQMRTLAGRLAIPVADDIWPTLVEAATFDRMRDRADQLVPNASRGVFRDNRRFFAHGTVGRWRELLDDGDLARYNDRVAGLAAEDLAQWAHRPSS